MLRCVGVTLTHRRGSRGGGGLARRRGRGEDGHAQGGECGELHVVWSGGVVGSV